MKAFSENLADLNQKPPPALETTTALSLGNGLAGLADAATKSFCVGLPCGCVEISSQNLSEGCCRFWAVWLQV